MNTIRTSICALIFLAVGSGQNMSLALPAAETLPLVTSANAPFYPTIPRRARIEGVVRLRITTDGSRVASIAVESGPPMLVPAAQENVKTWQFKKHNPTTFETTFTYRMLPQSECYMDNETMVLHLPTEVEVSAKGVQHCEGSPTRR